MIAIDSYRVSGPAKGVLDLCDSARGYVDPVVLVFERGPRKGSEFQSECRYRGIHLEVVRERRRYDLTLPSRIVQMARALRPDLVQTHGYKPDVLGLIVARRLGIPWVAFSHGPTDEGRRMRLYLALDHVLLRRADRVVAVSRARKAALEACGFRPNQVVTIPNAVDLRRHVAADAGAARNEFGFHPDQPVVGVVGRLSPEKGHTYFVEAMAEIVRSLPRAVGLIVGDGPQEGRLRAQTAALGLENVVRFAGYRRDMDRIYSAIDALVLPSIQEGLPNVVLEAMASGRPVVASRVGGVPEVVDDGATGSLVPPGDSHALAQAIVSLLEDPARREAMGAAARQRIEHAFSARSRAERILSLYRAVLHERGPAPGAPHQAAEIEGPLHGEAGR